MVVTKDFLESGRSKNGGWNKGQLNTLGIHNFESKWKKKVIGTIISEAAARLFIELKDIHLIEKTRPTQFIEREKINWKDQYKHPLWQKRRLEIMQRDDYHCMICGKTDEQLHVHHNRYDSEYVWKCKSSSMITLCTSCHELYHGRRFK